MVWVEESTVTVRHTPVGCNVLGATITKRHSLLKSKKCGSVLRVDDLGKV